MKRIVLLSLISSTLILSGCLSTPESPGKNDLEINISMKEKSFSSDSEYINLTIQLLNKANKDVKIYKAYELMMSHEIICPNNEMLEQIHIVDIVADRIVFESGGIKEYTINLKETQFNLNGSRYNWDMIGEYKIRSRYIDNEIAFYSDYLTFEIIE